MRANEEKIFPMPDYYTRYRNNNHRGGCKSQQYSGENPTHILVSKGLWSCLPTRILVGKAPVSCWDLHSKGRAVMLPCDNATRPAFIADAFRLVATRTISSERSIPLIRPLVTLSAASLIPWPAPKPTSSTVSVGWISSR